MTKNKLQMWKAAFLAPLLVGLSLSIGPAGASQDDDIAALKARLATDQAAADTLTGRLAPDRARLGKVQVADLFGPSDAEKAAAAAAAQHEQAQDASIATLNQRASDLEDSLRKLTGQIEVIGHRLDELDQRIDRVNKEFNFKLCALSAQQLGATAAPGDTNAIPCNGSDTSAQPYASSDAPSPSGDAAPPQGVTHLAPPPGVLGTLPSGADNNLPQPQATAPNQFVSIDTHSQFDSAMNMLAKSQYDEARGAFRTFADAYPKDSLAPQALYWVGDIAYVQKDYPSAARAFAEELKKYPTSPRAPESMLKLGQSLIAMNQKDEGCTALHALAIKYPTASKTVLGEADAIRKAGGCRR